MSEPEGAWALLTPEELAWKETCRAFAEEVIRPAAPVCDRENRFPAEVHEAAWARGLMHPCLPRALGGGGRSWRSLAVGGEELAAVCAPTAFTLGFNHGALRPVLHAGDEAQRARFVTDLLARRGYASLCLTEPDASGSNLLAVRALARADGDGWVLSGTKCMVGNGTVAELFLVLADTEERGRRRGPSFFAVPRGPGVRIGPNTDKLGFRCVPTPTVAFEDVRLDAGCLVGAPGQAEQVLLETLDFIRFGGAAVILGIVVGALRDLVPWLEARRVAPDEPLVAKSDVQLTLGGLYAEVQAVRLLMWRAADLLDQGRPCATETAAAKYLASELAVRATNACAQLYGWRGVDGDWPAAKRLRDARATTIYEGTSQVQQLGLARALRRSVRAGGWL